MNGPAAGDAAHENGGYGDAGGMEVQTTIGARLARSWRDGLWLAGQDARRAWPSFPATALTALIGGLYTGAFLLAIEGEGVFYDFLLGFWFLMLVPVLGSNFLFNRDYYYNLREDNLSKRLAFLRSLPISAGAVVVGRAAIMLLTLACAAPAFFSSIYLSSPTLQARLGPAQYLAFSLGWLGYALFMGGFLLFVWLGLPWRKEGPGSVPDLQPSRSGALHLRVRRGGLRGGSGARRGG
jgi:hypothetical protein